LKPDKGQVTSKFLGTTSQEYGALSKASPYEPKISSCEITGFLFKLSGAEECKDVLDCVRRATTASGINFGLEERQEISANLFSLFTNVFLVFI
jgi:hypothetical protein